MHSFVALLVLSCAALAQAGGTECSDQHSCSDCTGLAWCGWASYGAECLDTSDYTSTDTYIESSPACACLEESGKGCGPCTNKAIFCDYCEGSGGYEQCTEDTTFNTNACPGWIDSFSCESDDF